MLKWIATDFTTFHLHFTNLFMILNMQQWPLLQIEVFNSLISIFNGAPFIRPSNLEQWMHSLSLPFLSVGVFIYFYIVHFSSSNFRLRVCTGIFRNLSVANLTFLRRSSSSLLWYTNAECVYCLFLSIKLHIDFVDFLWGYFTNSVCIYK